MWFSGEKSVLHGKRSNDEAQVKPEKFPQKKNPRIGARRHDTVRSAGPSVGTQLTDDTHLGKAAFVKPGAKSRLKNDLLDTFNS